MAILETQINGKYPKNAKRRQPTENQLKNSNTLEFARFQGFSRKNTETHVALRGNFSGLVSTIDPVKSLKDAASLVVCTRKNIF